MCCLSQSPTVHLTFIIIIMVITPSSMQQWVACSHLRQYIWLLLWLYIYRRQPGLHAAVSSLSRSLTVHLTLGIISSSYRHQPSLYAVASSLSRSLTVHLSIGIISSSAWPPNRRWVACPVLSQYRWLFWLYCHRSIISPASMQQ